MGRITWHSTLFLIVAVFCGWLLLARDDASISVPSNTKPRTTKMTTLTTRDVVNQSGTKADIMTTKQENETDAAFATRHNATIAAWKASTTPS